MSTEPIGEFFDREAEPCCRPEADPGGGVAGVSALLLDRAERQGIRGRTVLDLGCGMGGVALEALRRGASRVTGIDLSPVSIEVARRRAAESGAGDRARFEAADGAAPGHPQHDVVVLNKAICCYPDPERFVAASAPAAGSVYAFSVPESRGPWGLLSRTVIFLENAWRWIRRDPFRAFVHDVTRIDRAIRDRGLEPADRARQWMWHVAVYRRAGPAVR